MGVTEMSGFRRAAGMLVLGAVLAAGCAPGPPAVRGPPSVEGRFYVDCEIPRPESCPDGGEPVCAYRLLGRLEYPSACDACASERVRGYRPGPCPAPADVEMPPPGASP